MPLLAVRPGAPALARTTTRPATSVSVVVPTTGCERLPALVRSLRDVRDPATCELVVVDDRAVDRLPLLAETDEVRIVTSGGRGVAAARNAGLRETSGEWVVFLDDDAVLTPTWYDDLLVDLAGARRRHVAVQARIEAGGEDVVQVSRRDEAPTPADLAYRRLALVCLGGFEERFPRAGREDVEVVLRAARAGWRLAQGARVSLRDSVPDGWQVPSARGALHGLAARIATAGRRGAGPRS